LFTNPIVVAVDGNWNKQCHYYEAGIGLFEMQRHIEIETIHHLYFVNGFQMMLISWQSLPICPVPRMPIIFLPILGFIRTIPFISYFTI